MYKAHIKHVIVRQLTSVTLEVGEHFSETRLQVTVWVGILGGVC